MVMPCTEAQEREEQRQWWTPPVWVDDLEGWRAACLEVAEITDDDGARAWVEARQPVESTPASDAGPGWGTGTVGGCDSIAYLNLMSGLRGMLAGDTQVAQGAYLTGGQHRVPARVDPPLPPGLPAPRPWPKAPDASSYDEAARLARARVWVSLGADKEAAEAHECRSGRAPDDLARAVAAAPRPPRTPTGARRPPGSHVGGGNSAFLELMRRTDELLADALVDEEG